MNGSSDFREQSFAHGKFVLIQKDAQPITIEFTVDEAGKVFLGVRASVVDENVVGFWHWHWLWQFLSYPHRIEDERNTTRDRQKLRNAIPIRSEEYLINEKRNTRI